LEEELSRKMRDVMAKAHDEPGAEVYGAAVAILRHYLGDEFIAKKVRLSPAPDAFLLNEENDQSDGRFVHMTRVAELADFLFILKDSPGFDVLCNRLRNREIQASFSDAMAAATFREHGFNVEIRSERGVRGEDFDFSARKDGAPINLEVTSSTSPLFRPETISNILSSKRDQLPADAPAGLYCVIAIKFQGFSTC
jgi:hypothetical protein